MDLSIITERTRERLAKSSMAEQLSALRDQLTIDERLLLVENMLKERRKHQIPIEIERRGYNPHRNGWEDNDTLTDSI